MSLRTVRSSSSYAYRASAIPINANYTICSFVYLVSDPGAGNWNNFWYLAGSNVASDYEGIQLNRLTLNLFRSRQSSAYAEDEGTTLATGTWYFLAQVRNGSTITAYLCELGGTVAADATVTQAVTSGVGTTYLGTWQGSYDYGDNRYFSTRVWTSALTLSELQAESESADYVKSSPWAVWQSPYGGANLTDISGNSRNLTNSGTLNNEVDPDIGTTDDLTATNITTGSPTLGTPSITQTHILTATGITTSAPVLGPPAIGQSHILDASGITTSNPVLGTPTLGNIHALVASDISTGNPTLDAPGIGQTHVLQVNDLVAGSPTLDAPGIGQSHLLQASNIDSGQPVLGTPTLAGPDVLEATNITTGLPDLGAPGITQTHILQAIGITTSNPVVGAPSLSGADTLEATTIVTGAPTLGTPSISQTHVLDASGIITPNPELGTPALSTSNILQATDIVTGAPVLDAPGIGQTHILVISDLFTGIPTLGAPSLFSGVPVLEGRQYAVIIADDIQTVRPRAIEDITPTDVQTVYVE